MMYFLYFDPGLGAMIIQTIIAAVAGFILFSKNLMYKIKLFLGLAKPHRFYLGEQHTLDADTR